MITSNKGKRIGKGRLPDYYTLQESAMNMRVVPVDTGNRMMKTNKLFFPSGLVKHGKKKPPEDTGRPVETLFFDGEYYTLTDETLKHRHDKTADGEYFKLNLFAIAKHLLATSKPVSSFNKDIVLSMGVPILHMDELKDKYPKYFSNDGREIEFSYMGIEFKIRVREVLVNYQGLAAVVPIYNKVAEFPTSNILDIGGWTFDRALLNFGKLGNTYDTIETVGVDHFYTMVKREARSKLSIPALDDVTIKAIIDGNASIKEDKAMADVIDLVGKMYYDYRDEIWYTIVDQGIDIRSTLPIFIGGCSLVFKKAIMEKMPEKKMVFIDNIMANAIGYYRLALAKLE